MTTVTALKAGLPAPPPRMAHLPLDARGYPVPKFVLWEQGVPDFRIMDTGHLRDCVTLGRCWLCGGVMGSYRAYVVGPMCVVNRVSSEPPSHRECAEYAARACPFLVHPKMERIEGDMPPEATMAGCPIKRNPGVAAVYVTRSPVRPVPGSVGGTGNGGVLFDMGDPSQVLWFARGRQATRQEAVEAVEAGMPALRTVAEQHGEVAALDAAVQKAMGYLP